MNLDDVTVLPASWTLDCLDPVGELEISADLDAPVVTGPCRELGASWSLARHLASEGAIEVVLDLDRAVAINWVQVEDAIGTREGGEAEKIVHEMAHVFECLGTQKSLSHVGRQGEVHDLIHEAFKTERGRDASEVRVSAITHLVLVALGRDGERDRVRTALLDNIEQRTGAWARQGASFDALVAKPSSRVQKAVSAIVKAIIDVGT